MMLTGSRAERIGIPLLLCAAVILGYAGAIAHPFLFDDEAAILANPAVLGKAPLPLSARWLVDASFRLNAAIGGVRPAAFRGVNLAIHAGSALLFYGALRRILAARRMRWNPVAARRAAGLAALLWALHPLQTQAVTYICQRYESLMALFFLGCLYTFVRGVEIAASNERPQRARGWFNASLACCLAGMGAKEVMAAAPPVILLLDILVLAPEPREVWRRRRVHIALWLTLGVLAVLETRMIAGAVTAGAGVAYRIPPRIYLMTQAQVIVHYFRLSVVPWPLCFDYAWPWVTSWRDVLPELAALTALIGLLLWGAWRRHPAAMAGWFVFAVLAPSSSIVPVPDAAVEHRMHLPLAGIMAFLVVAGYRLAGRGNRARAAAMVALALVLVFAALTLRRNADYASAERMWSDVLRQRPHNNRAAVNLAAQVLSAGRPDEAERLAASVTQRLAYLARTDAAAIPAWGEGVEEVRRQTDARYYAVAHNLRGVVTGRRGDPEQAARHFAEALRVMPGFVDARQNLTTARQTLNPT